MNEDSATLENIPKKSIHKSVLLQEVLEGLALHKGGIVLDGTINGGGHSEAICKQIGEEGVLVGMDLDQGALKRAEARLAECGTKKVILANENFKNMQSVAHTNGIKSFDGILLDLGFSSDQLEHGGRGFSFQKNEPLILSLQDDNSKILFAAHHIVNEWTKEQISDVLHGYGEERFANRIAERIVENRKEKPIETTNDLVDVVRRAVPKWYRFARLHPATKTFQALRIAVNDEIESLREGLESALDLLGNKGRLVVISFHSIEDRIVKRAFEAASRDGRGTIITKKPLTPQAEEIVENPRSRSAKLRVFERAEH